MGTVSAMQIGTFGEMLWLDTTYEYVGIWQGTCISGQARRR